MSTMDELREAQRRLDENAAWERAQGINWETVKYLRLNGEVNRLLRRRAVERRGLRGPGERATGGLT